MFESLQERLEKSWKIIKGEGKISEININQTLKEVLRALTDADVSYKVAKNFIDSVKAKALGQDVIGSNNPKGQMLSIVRSELIELMGGEKPTFNLNGNPAVILMSGLQGSGKTTFSAKIARMLKSKGRRPLLVAGDVYRPAAADQLRTLAGQIEADIYEEPESKDPVQISLNAMRYAKEHHNDVVIIDTAGRLDIDEDMMREIENIKRAVNPGEILFVVDSMMGQSAVITARTFNERLDFDGIVVTKLDGDAKAGVVLSIRSVVKKPIKFIGTGEKIGDVEEFNPEGMAGRIMGEGDLWALAKKATDVISEEEAKKLEEKMRKNKFDFEDFMKQIQNIKKMGNLKSLASMIPGIGKQIKDLDIDDNAFKSIEAIINSMTVYERRNPGKIDASRRKRIAAGSGTTLAEVNRLMKQFEQTRKMMHTVTSKNPAELMKRARAAQQQMRRRR